MFGRVSRIPAWLTSTLIISSHLIEHVPDLIGHINDCFEILNTDGVYCLAVPDKRYSFDIMREVTSLEQVIARKGNITYKDSTIIDYVKKVVRNGEDVSWLKTDMRKDFHQIYSENEVARITENPKSCDVDVHVSVFTPDSFQSIMTTLYQMKLIKMPLVFIDQDTEYGEFFAVFKKTKQDSMLTIENWITGASKMKKKLHIDESHTDNGHYLIKGWSQVNDNPPDEIHIRIGKREYRATRYMRPDLSSDINHNKFGFFCTIPILEIPKGFHLLHINVVSQKKQKSYCAPTILFRYKESIADLKQNIVVLLKGYRG